MDLCHHKTLFGLVFDTSTHKKILHLNTILPKNFSLNNYDKILDGS